MKKSFAAGLFVLAFAANSYAVEITIPWDQTPETIQKTALRATKNHKIDHMRKETIDGKTTYIVMVKNMDGTYDTTQIDETGQVLGGARHVKEK